MATRRPTQSPGKSAAVPPTEEKAPPRKRPSRAKQVVAKAARPLVKISEDVRRGMIAEGAYLRAERRSFTGGNEREDWLAAEAEVDALLSAEHKTPQ
jgi:hypothetical protein